MYKIYHPTIPATFACVANANDEDRLIILSSWVFQIIREVNCGPQQLIANYFRFPPLRITSTAVTDIDKEMTRGIVYAIMMVRLSFSYTQSSKVRQSVAAKVRMSIGYYYFYWILNKKRRNTKVNKRTEKRRSNLLPHPFNRPFICFRLCIFNLCSPLPSQHPCVGP